MKVSAIIVCLLLLFPFAGDAQTYKYIGVENGLSNRRIFNIQKDSTGYMWFLTNEGIDRYDGKYIRHYKPKEESKELVSPVHLGWLYVDGDGNVWSIGRAGCIFHYNSGHDCLDRVYKLPKNTISVNYSYMDKGDNLWLCNKYSIVLYDTKAGETRRMPNILDSNITSIEQVSDSRFFIATETGIRYVQLEGDTLQILPQETLDEIQAQVSVLYYHPQSQRLFIGTFAKGIFAYDIRLHQIIYPSTDLSDVNIAQIAPLNETELLIATEGMGIHKIDVNTCVLETYVASSYRNYNEMNSNTINDIYIDEEKRIWIANYPEGITVIDNRYKNYNWIKHSIGNRQSLVNDQVHSVIEDSDGDLWFGTSNGISLYERQTGQWHSFLSSFDHQLKDKNHIFITLCEVSPGVIWAGGYTSGIYKINKRTLSVEYFSPYQIASNSMRPDKFIRDIIKDSRGRIWSGGYYNLKCIDLVQNSVRLYPGINSVTAIIEKDNNNMWIGTSTGLYLLDKESGDFQYIVLLEEPDHINALYQAKDGLLYIGTNSSGVIVFNAEDHSFKQYHMDNCALVSNSIYTILPERDGCIMMSTENGICCFNTKGKVFQNWTKEQGLMSACFSACSGTLCRHGGFAFGSTDGALEFPSETQLPQYTYSPMIVSDFQISYQTVYPGEKNSPLEEDINQTDELRLKYNQNTFSLRISSINYDAPNNVIFYWKLEGFYDEWERVGDDGLIRFANLDAGSYTLSIRAVSKEEPYLYFEERNMDISIARPIWLSMGAIICYIALLVLLFTILSRNNALKKQKKISDEKTRFFINTAHDIRTPLTLIKAPLEEMLENKTLNAHETENTNMALRNVNHLLEMATNLINFERAELYSSKLFISEHNLGAYIEEVSDTFRTYASMKHIAFHIENNCKELNVWFDKSKMDSILKNVLSNALKYTPENGEVRIGLDELNSDWQLTVKDNGIGIPSKERKKLLRIRFRGSNAINAKITGSGIGLMLVKKLVHLHSGKIAIESIENQGCTVTITFPKEYTSFKNYQQTVAGKQTEPMQGIQPPPAAVAGETLPAGNERSQRILIVEDNDELRSYLAQFLSADYNVLVCSNGKEALDVVKQYCPDLILSDIMMPEMQGDELCIAIKQDIETSHIPVLLLTALGEEQQIVNGLQIGADAYIVKPFSISILKARIANLLKNRDLLRSKFANLEIEPLKDEPAIHSSNSLDLKFMSEVKKQVEENMDNPDFTVDSLCSLMNMSRTSFYNKLKALTGQAPADFVRNIRLKRAAQLLTEGKYSIIEIADMTGFCDGKYFREVFRKYYNVSPSQYAKGERGDSTTT